jgi:hypothetical protein
MPARLGFEETERMVQQGQAGEGAVRFGKRSADIASSNRQKQKDRPEAGLSKRHKPLEASQLSFGSRTWRPRYMPVFRSM